MNERPIDVWNVETFDDGLLAAMKAKRNLLRDYTLTDLKQFRRSEAEKDRDPHPTNPFAAERNNFVEHIIMPAMAQRKIRAWHYTRLTDDEAALLQVTGIHISNLDAIRRRLDVQITAGILSAETADAMYAASPFHEQNKSRAGKFWMTSHPIAVNHDGVEPLLEHWGGEGVYFWLKDPKLIELVKSLGRSRVIELAVPLQLTRHSYSAAQAVVATFVRSLGCEADWSSFDLYTTSALNADAVLKIHTEGEPNFADLARGYPAGFVDRER